MRDNNDRPNFTFLWAIGAMAALGWVFEPVLGQAIQSGGGLSGRMVLENPLGLWMRGAVTGLFVLLGLYEQHTLARMESRTRGFRQVLDALPDVVWTARAGGPRNFLSPNASRILGYAPEALVKDDGRLWWEAIHPDDRPTVRRAYDGLFASDAPYAIEYRLRRPDGTWTWVGERSVLTFVREGVRHANGVVCDVSERKHAEEATRLAGRFDPVTSLPGRDLLDDRLSQALAYARRHRLQVAVLYLGFAGLAETAETLGRRVAEPLLKEVSARLCRVVREEDTVARHDDAHMVIVLPAIPEARHAARVTQAVIEALDTVIEVRGQPLSLGVNVGLSFFPTDGDDAETLIKHAASAMGRSRRQGRNSYELYTPDMHQAAVRRIHLEAGLRRAVERNELALHFQPQFDLATGRVAGLEALLRWSSPDNGPVSPVEFIPIAEETGLIVPVGTWVLRAACAQASRWRKAGLEPGRIAVNVSARQLEGDLLTETIAAVLKETGLPAADLELEITESALVRNAEEAGRTLERIRRMGVGLAVDDFGTGHAALAYLRRFPIETLKIDRTFVAPCAGDPEDAAIVQALIAMAHSLKLRVVAEGVETEAQLAFLKANGCDAAQGFLLARPVPADDLGRFLAAGGQARQAGMA